MGNSSDQEYINLGGMNWEVEIDIYTLLHIKQMTNKNLLFVTENYISYFITTYENTRNILVIGNKTLSKVHAFTELTFGSGETNTKNK